MHENWPPDLGFQRPDAIWELPPPERGRRAQEGNDLCILDGERYFIRAVLKVPLLALGTDWGLGLWVEVSEVDFRRYHDLYDVDATIEPGFEGTIANALKAFPDAIGRVVEVRLGSSSQRPTLVFGAGASGRFAEAQRLGLTGEAFHAAVGIERPSWLQ